MGKLLRTYKTEKKKSSMLLEGKRETFAKMKVIFEMKDSETMDFLISCLAKFGGANDLFLRKPLFGIIGGK